MPKRIPLTQSKYADVDDEDYDYLRQWRWRYATCGYAVRTIRVDGKTKRIWMHRAIMDARPGELVDHIDTDRLNNTRANLRFVTGSQNQWNRNQNRTSASPHKGVSNHRKGWHARVRVFGQRIHLGYFDTPEAAAHMYDAAARHFFGIYARVNFPNVPTTPATQAVLVNVLSRRALKVNGADSLS